MKKKNLLLIILGLIFGIFTEFVAQSLEKERNGKDDKQENSLLWKIDGNELAAPSYVYGTMHVLCVDSFNLPAKVLRAFEQTEVLELEINFSDPKEMEYMQAAMFNEEKLSTTLDSTQLIILSEFLAEHLGYAIEQVDNFSLSTLLVIAETKVDGCTAPVSIENELTQLALAGDYEIKGLETAKQQMEMLDEATDLEEDLEKMKHFKNNEEDFYSSQSLYLAERLNDCVAILVNSEDMTEKEIELVVNKRNREWAASIPGQIQEQTTFIAVGAAHLVGSEGLIELLRAEGYKVTPVYN